MSTPNPFTLPDEHWQNILLFINQQAERDGVSGDFAQMIDLIRQYWVLLNDETALTSRVGVEELQKLKDNLVRQESGVEDLKQEIARRER